MNKPSWIQLLTLASVFRSGARGKGGRGRYRVVVHIVRGHAENIPVIVLGLKMQRKKGEINKFASLNDVIHLACASANGCLPLFVFRCGPAMN